MQSQRTVISQEQRLKMSPQMYQSIQLMALPIQDLRLKIAEEIDKNPALEQLEMERTASLDEVPEKKSEDFDPFENSSDPGYTTQSGGSSGGEDTKRKFLEGTISRGESLQDHLLWQLHMTYLTERELEIGELIISNLDGNGFHIGPPSVLVREDESEILEKMIVQIQGFDPLGICVADHRDSLLLQAQFREDMPEELETVLTDLMELLEKEKYNEIIRQLKISRERWEEIMYFLKSLDPYPGSFYSESSYNYVIPDLIVRRKEGEFVIVLNDEEIPVLRINSFFEDIQEGEAAAKDKKVKQFVNGRVRDARWFIGSINQRNMTLLKTATAILEFQREFFRRGPKYLKPLTLKDVAGEIGVHEATVSRITTNKYVQTEWGIYELKHFFSNSISGAGSGGSKFSKEGVKEVIREIIAESSSEKKLSDQKISDLLSKKGINIARRTVAKYRNELALGSSFKR
ncbi:MULTISPECIES: RNA polymerase factor sigma-54 [unclassified Oceanispirochaeta]|uniref:RNA polymerase factor sigma-54 n=1 Tax=unclassified Oceanispirochaeta TaxID=2635722 RepID=UPI000E096C7B|nr:RNA polymerase factor sigma-54 [Oceanispirochaeta sp. M1]MBF9015347.1 RNA polymerase factor sigma-54 [Oceanispirochaeta sp. M2]NPD71805.1 RNA polymerase factor sigma-54 [Oceanispirochaeta sp. M1]RDG32994.1 RNA polymerase sigma-54 factor [Oceanispirochaeta sp. M1]